MTVYRIRTQYRELSDCLVAFFADLARPSTLKVYMLRFRIDVFLRELRCSFLEILTTRWPCYKNERQVAIDWYENRVENFFPNEMDGRSVLILYLVRFAAEDILFTGRFRMFERFTKQIDAAVIRWKNLSLVIRQKCFVRIDVFLRELRCNFLEILTTRWPCYKNERQVAKSCRKFFSQWNGRKIGSHPVSRTIRSRRHTFHRSI